MKKILDWTFYDLNFIAYKTNVYEKKIMNKIYIIAIFCNNEFPEFEIEYTNTITPIWSISDEKISKMFNHELEILGNCLAEIVFNNKFSH